MSDTKQKNRGENTTPRGCGILKCFFLKVFATVFVVRGTRATSTVARSLSYPRRPHSVRGNSRRQRAARQALCETRDAFTTSVVIKMSRTLWMENSPFPFWQATRRSDSILMVKVIAAAILYINTVPSLQVAFTGVDATKKKTIVEIDCQNHYSTVSRSFYLFEKRKSKKGTKSTTSECHTLSMRKI